MELALCLPLLFIFLLGIVQLVVIVRDQLAVQLAAREAAALRQSPRPPMHRHMARPIARSLFVR